MPPVRLDLEGVGKRYGGLWVLRNCTLSVGPGESLGLMGPSGSGKSTLARIATGLEAPDTGRVFWDGKDIRSLGRNRYRNGKVLLLPQNAEGALNPMKTVKSLLLEVCRLGGIPTQAEESTYLRALEEVELSPDILRYRPPQLSGGMNQRVLLARLILRQPGCIIFDEPTSGLDVSIQASILHVMRKLQRENAFSSLVISHDRDVVRFLCSRVMILRGKTLYPELSESSTLSMAGAAG